MRLVLRPTQLPGAVALIALVLSFPSAVAAEEWLSAERLTTNDLEDRTTSGSLDQPVRS